MEHSKFRSRKAKKIIPPFHEVYDVNPEASSAFVAGLYSVNVELTHGSSSGNNTIIEGRTAQVTLVANSGWFLPASISVQNATFSYNASTGVVSLSEPTNNVAISGACDASIGVNVTGGTFSGDDRIALGTGTAEVTITANAGSILPTSVSVTGASYAYDSSTGVISLSNATGIVAIAAVCISADPVLENNTWATIKAICEAGRASAIWSIGDSKNVTGGDTYTRPATIVDMQGLYNKHVVFQIRSLTSTDVQWNPFSNTDDDSCYNNYLISDMNTTHLIAGGTIWTQLLGTGDLAAQLTNTTVKVAKNGNSSVLVDVTNKLFLPAEREIFASRSSSRQNEWDALVRYQYYATNDTSDARKLAKPSTGNNYIWWERSPRSGSTSFVCVVSNDGFADYYGADDSSGVAPCFAF